MIKCLDLFENHHEWSVFLYGTVLREKTPYVLFTIFMSVSSWRVQSPSRLILFHVRELEQLFSQPISACQHNKIGSCPLLSLSSLTRQITGRTSGLCLCLVNNIANYLLRTSNSDQNMNPLYRASINILVPLSCCPERPRNFHN